MKKIFSAVLITATLTQSLAYAQNNMVLPDAANDFVYTVINDTNATPIPTEIPTATPIPDLIIEPVPEETATPIPTELPQSTYVPTQTAIPTATPTSAFTANTFTANFTVEGNGKNKQQDIKFELYDGGILLDESVYSIKADERSFSVSFDVPDYAVGKKFEIVCVSGAEAVRYYDKLYQLGEKVDAPTYHYMQNGTSVVVTHTAMNIVTEKDYELKFYIEKEPYEFKCKPRIVNGTIMVPVRETAEALGVSDVTYNAEYNSVRVAVASNEILFNIDYPWTSVNKEIRVDKVSTRYYDGSVFVPLDTLAYGINSAKEEWQHDTYIDILLGKSKLKENYVDKVKYITDQKLTSKTEYLIWVSKKKYEVNVFKNIGGVWNFVDVFPCSIGTDETPTCVGTYRYYEKIDRWTYPDFYVAPVMRFNGGYAIHSTLIKYDGTDYNRAVGKKLSHGCVRVQPPDMQWLIENIPMYTTIHVTNI